MIITLLIGVQNTVTTRWQAARGSAPSGKVSISSSVVASLTHVNDSVTTFGSLAVDTAASTGGGSGRVVGVFGSLITSFGNSHNKGGSHGFLSAISTSAVRKFWNIIDDLFQEFVGGLGSGASLEEHGGDQKFGGSERGFVNELDFQVVHLALDPMVRGGVEDQLLQDILNSLVDESVSICLVNWGSEKIAGVKHPEVLDLAVSQIEI